MSPRFIVCAVHSDDSSKLITPLFFFRFVLGLPVEVAAVEKLINANTRRVNPSFHKQIRVSQSLEAGVDVGYVQQFSLLSEIIFDFLNEFNLLRSQSKSVEAACVSHSGRRWYVVWMSSTYLINSLTKPPVLHCRSLEGCCRILETLRTQWSYHSWNCRR